MLGLGPFDSRLDSSFRLALVAVFALVAGCAPPATFRPITPMLGEQKNELGWGFTVGDQVSPRAGGERIGAADLWYYHQFAGWFDLGARMFGGTMAGMRADGGSSNSTYVNAGFGVGPTLRFRLVNAQPFKLGIDVNTGWPWLQVGIPVAVQLENRVWLYSDPQMTIFSVNPGTTAFGLGFPVGASIRATASLAVLLELTPVLFGPQRLVLEGGAGVGWRF